MLKAMIQKIEEMATAHTFNVEGSTFTDKPLMEVVPRKDTAQEIRLTGLDSVCKMVRNEACDLFPGDQILVQVESYDQIRVFTTLDGELDRNYLYRCDADTPDFPEGQYLEQERMIILLQSMVIPNEDSNYLLKLLSRVCSKSAVSTRDNGVTQTIEATQGIALTENVEVRSIVSLKPFRTFLEVTQPESKFLVRVKDGGRIALIEADGGVWKLEATRNVENWLESRLEDLINEKKVIILR